MKLQIFKRDNTLVDFDSDKIFNAVRLAFEDIDGELTSETKRICLFICNTIAQEVLRASFNDKHLSVETIQDSIESLLCDSNRKDVASAYIRYRYKKEVARNFQKDFIDEIRKKLSAGDVQNQNANVDEYSFGGRIGEASEVVTKQLAKDYIISDMAKYNHENNIIYIHDFGSYYVGSHNCLSIPFDDLLKNGFNTRQTDVRPANSINTAFQLLAVIFQLQSLQQFGGVSATHLDWTMVPYLRKSFFKHYVTAYLKTTEEFVKLNLLDLLFDTYDEKIGDSLIVTRNKFEDWVDSHKKEFLFKMGLTESDFYFDNNNLDPMLKQSALYDTVIELKQAVEGMYHNLNTLQSRSGNQLPFTSINYGTCTLTEGRIIVRELLQGSIRGVGKLHKTSIFPCGIFQYMKGVNDKEGTPNYDLYRLALQSTSKRLYPNYANVDWSGNAGYDRNDPRTYFSTMGALAGHEHLYIKVDEDVYDISIKDLFNYCKTGEIHNARPCNVYFNKSRKNVYEDKFISQKSDIEAGAGVYKITYIPEDVSYIGSSENVNRRLTEHRYSIRHTGGLQGGVCFADTNVDNYRFEVLEYCSNYKEKEHRYIESIPNVNFKGTAKKYYKSVNSRKDIIKRPHFLQDRTIPQDLINIEDKDIKVLDRDNKWVRIKHIFKNDKRNSPFMMHINYKEHEREFCLSCTEDHPLWTGNTFKRADKLKVGDKLYRADNEELTITKITWHWSPVDSYDIGTETGSFIGSDIIMHNCRTANGADINAEPGQNPYIKDGRGNICPVTIIMPTLAMMARQAVFDKHYTYVDEEQAQRLIVKEFLEILNLKIHEAKDMLIERFNWIASQSPKAAKFMYENNIMLGYKSEEGIVSALKHGTLAIGQLGLAETLQILTGCDHTTEKGMKLAKEIENMFKTLCAEFKEEYKLNFGVYYTPAENLCYTAMKKFKDKYGIIENVSDKDYFTNSIHVPVYDDVSVFDKIDIEAQLTGYSSAGCITYVELDGTVQKNVDALEEIVNYAMQKDIPYFAVNVPNDTCLNCGYTGEFNDKCPACGSTEIQQLRRVTGYLTGDYKSAFNEGKQQETENRVKHVNYME